MILLYNKYATQYTCEFYKAFKALQNKPLVSSIFVNLFLFALFFTFFSPMYETNDDLSMMRIVSGQRLGEPSEYIIYINVIIGKLLQQFYIHFPFYNWYVIIFYILHFIAMIVVLFVILNNSRFTYNYLLFIMLFVFFEVHFLARLQFTTTAFVIGFSGLLLLISVENNNQKSKWVIYSLGVLLLVISGLFRDNVFFLLILLGLPLFLHKTIYQRNILMIAPLIIAIVIILGARAYDNFYYERDPGWSYYFQYNSLRSQLTDYPHYAWNENTIEVYEEVGWSENDVKMFRGWSYADQVKFSLEDLSFIVSQIDPSKQSLLEVLKALYRFVFKVDLTKIWFAVVIAILAILFGRKSERALIVSLIIIVAAVSIYLSYFGRLPLRIMLPLFYGISLISIYFITMKHNMILNKIIIIKDRNAFIIAGLTLFLFITFSTLINDYYDNRNRIGSQLKFDNIDQVLSSYDYIYAVSAGFLSSRTLEISFVNQKAGDMKRVSMGGWSVPSPHYFHELSRYGVEAGYFVLLEDDVLIIADLSQLDKLALFFKENYQLNIVFEPAITVEGITAYQTILIR